MRTLALAQAWKRDGGQVTFVCGDIPRGLVKRIEGEGSQVYRIQNSNCDGADAKDTQEIASVVQPNWIVLDGYRFDDSYQRSIRSSSAKVLVVDDYGHASHQIADLVLNQNVYATANDYGRHCRTKVLAGSKFALLRNEFANLHFDPNEPRRIPAEARRILVTFGGADPDNWTLKALQAIGDVNKKRLIVDCVLGACYAHIAELETFKKSSHLSLRIHRNVDRMSHLMSRVDLAITAGGSTCYELARCGVPSIVASIAENQLQISKTMNDRGVMLSVDEINEATGEPTRKLNGPKFKQVLKQLISDGAARQAMSNKGMRLVDGKGPQRIIRAMSAGTIGLRPATMQDIDVMWGWRNDPEVRSVMLCGKPVSFETFTDSIGQQLSNANTKIWIAENSKREPIAQITFTLNQNSNHGLSNNHRINVIVDQTCRGRGLGTILITQACEEHFNDNPCDSIVAQIKPGNTACEKAFRSSGFEFMEPAIVDGKMAFQAVLKRSWLNTISDSVPRKKSA